VASAKLKAEGGPKDEIRRVLSRTMATSWKFDETMTIQRSSNPTIAN